jgi:hypothetical protein
MHINFSALARSIRFNCTSDYGTHPTTAYNALLHPAQVEDMEINPCRMAGNSIHPAAYKAVMHMILDMWQRPIVELNAHAVAWMMTHMSHYQQRFLHERLAMKPSASVPADVMDRLSGHLAALEAALLSKDPLMPNHLRESHRILISYPETVNLLDDNEIRGLIEGAVVYTKTEIVKAKTSAKKAASKVTIDDL